MKRSLFAIALLLVCSIVFISCDKDDNPSMKSKYVSELKQLYPDASRVEWSAMGAYGVAEFYNNGNEIKVWFTDNTASKWQMTETDMQYGNLPQSIRISFESGKYKNWKVDDIDKLDRVGVETVYVIEIENGEMEASLHYSVDGILVRTLTFDDDNNSLLPPITNMSTVIEEYIAANYPGAKIIDKDTENGMIEIDIIDGNKHKELVFNSKNEWLSTVTDLKVNETPQQIITAISSDPNYSLYQIDDIEFWQTLSGNYYLMELEGTGPDIKVKVSEDGLIIN